VERRVIRAANRDVSWGMAARIGNLHDDDTEEEEGELKTEPCSIRNSPRGDTMALPSGIYTIENVKYRNWAMLLNANVGEVVAGSSVSTNVGEKVSLLKM
jgi:hypothetical protein